MTASLTAVQLSELSAALERLEADLVSALETNSDSAQVVDLDQPIGRVSRIDAIQQQKMAAANRARTASRLDRIRAARAEVRRGEYGLCRACEEDIAFSRLEARPESPFCLSCQHEFETRGK